MAKFKAKVIVKAEVEYTVEVEVGSNREMDGEAEARAMWREMVPSDFQVNKGYITDLEVDKIQHLTSVCERCGAEYPMDMSEKEIAVRFAGIASVPKRWQEDQDFCAKCGLEIEAEEAALKAGE